MGTLEWIVLAAVAVLVLARLVRMHRRWNVRRAVAIVVGRPVALLFDLARSDDPVTPAERDYIAAYALTAFELLAAQSTADLDPAWLEQIVLDAEIPAGTAARDDYMHHLRLSPLAARNFFDICCALATADGEMRWREREWLELQGNLSMLNVHWFMGVLERECPCSKHPTAAGNANR